MSTNVPALLRQADQLPNGHAKADLTREAVRLADVARELPLQFESRLEHVSSCVFSGQVAEAIVAFTWLLNHREEFGDRRDHSFLWSYKWIIDSVIEVAEFSKEQVDHFINDAKARYTAYLGPEIRPIDSIEVNYRIQCGDFDQARALMAKVEQSRRGQLSDCLACDHSRRAIDWFQLGDAAKAAALHDEFLARRLSCSEEPTRANSRAALFYAVEGRWEDAQATYRAGSLKAHRTESLTLKCSRFGIAYKLLAKRPQEAIELFDRSVGIYLASVEKWPVFEFCLISHRLMEELSGSGKKLVRLKSAALLPFTGGSEAPVPVQALGDLLLEQARDIGERFDARNNASFFAGRLEARWPFVAGAP